MYNNLVMIYIDRYKKLLDKYPGLEQRIKSACNGNASDCDVLSEILEKNGWSDESKYWRDKAVKIYKDRGFEKYEY